MSQYIIVTPAKDEEKNAPNLIRSMVEQTIKPLLWVIVDDGSTDKTPNIIKKAEENYEWIQYIQLKKHPRDLSKHYAVVCNAGFDFATKYYKTNNLQYDYIGLLDADMILEPEFYSNLIEEFEKNSKLGIASGSVYTFINNKLFLEDEREDLPLGSARLWRKECFEEMGGGYPISYSADSVSNVLAKLSGWETSRFKEIKAVQTRRTSSAEGFWKGYKYHGISAYFRNYHPLFVLAKGIKLTFENPHYIGIAYLSGYLSAVIRRLGKIDNKEVRDYYYYQKGKDMIDHYKNKLINKIRWGNKRK